MIASSIERATEYFLDKVNATEVQIRFERLKKEFYSSPLDNKEREKHITSIKNIVFLYLEHKMIDRGMKLKQIIPQFDKDGKGYLSYDEFRVALNSLDSGVSENQISEVIKGVDSDGDGFINMQELEEVVFVDRFLITFRQWIPSLKDFWAWSRHRGDFMSTLLR
jgi:hypothetical protein